MNAASAFELVDTILAHYSSEDIETLKKAKETYFELTGKLDEDRTDYEMRMNMFNDWFIFHYQPDGKKTTSQLYFRHNEVAQELREIIYGVKYSLFQFVKLSYRKKIVIKNLITDEKYLFEPENCNIGIVEDDLFVGRILTINEDPILMRGICLLPPPVISILKKQIKKLKKEEANFHDYLLKIEKLKSKSVNYPHLPLQQIFS